MKKRMCLNALCVLLAALLLGGCGAGALPAAETAAPTPVVTETLQEEQQAAVVIFEEGADLYVADVGDTLCYSDASGTDISLIGYIPQGTQAQFLAVSGDFTKVKLPGGMEVYCRSWMLDPVDPAEKEQRDREELETLLGREKLLVFEDQPLRVCIQPSLGCLQHPDAGAPLLYELAVGSWVTVYGREGDYYLCRLPNEKLAWAPVASLCVTDRFTDVEHAVDLRELLPEAEFDILFASPRNITGHAMYSPIPIMEETTAGMLKEAYDIFRADGYTIKVYDSYRPKRAQYQLYDIVQDNRFIANPYDGNSWHQFGRAIDMSLINLETGEELLMPTPMHTFSTDASRWNEGQWDPQAKENVDYMTNVMLSCGFGLLSTEWWHFELNREYGFYLETDMTLDDYPTHMAY